MSKSKILIPLVACFIAIVIITSQDKSAQTNTSHASNASSIASAWQQLPKEGVVLEENKIAKNYYIVFDGSGSMGDSGCSGNVSKSEAAKNALKKFFSLLPDDVHTGLLTFDRDGIREVLPIGVHSSEDLTEKVRAVQPGGGTPLSTAIYRAVKSLESQGQKQLGYGEYTLVVVTDGEASKNEDANKPKVNPAK
jgi:Mg-chelatase subunit ChlD